MDDVLDIDEFNKATCDRSGGNLRMLEEVEEKVYACNN